MIKRCNYTNRHKIKRKHTNITIQQNGDEATFRADLSLKDYPFPSDSRVFVEAYRQASWQRFDFGTMQRIHNPDKTMLTGFASTDGVRFRVKVVEPSSNGSTGPIARILGIAEKISPDESGESNAKSLLSLVKGDSHDEVWQLVFSEVDYPVLRISSYLVPDKNALAADPAFATLVLPSVFRCVLTRIILIEGQLDMDDENNWMTQWLQLAVNLRGVEGPPPNEDYGNQEDWIDEAVAAFCRQIDNGKRFRNWQDDEGK